MVLNFDNPGLAPNFSKYFSHLIFVQSFYFQVGSTASYSNDDFEIQKVYYDVQKRKACAFTQSGSDPDIEVRIPTIRVVTTTSSKGDVMDFNLLLEPMDQAYALFSAIKRTAGLSRKKHSLTATLVPCTPMTKKLCGFETGNFKEAVNYSVANQERHKLCNGTWDTVLGRNWNMIPCHASDGEDVLIKTMRFTEHREFGMFTIRFQFLTSQGHYKNSKNRDLSRNVPVSHA